VEGASLYPSHLIDWHLDLLSRGVFGNPHSESPASLSSTTHEQAARRAVLEFLDADADIYEVIFTPNASGGLKIVTDNYPFDNKRLIVAMDAHNSVNGMACTARRAGGVVDMIQLENEHSTVDANEVEVSLGRVPVVSRAEAGSDYLIQRARLPIPVSYSSQANPISLEPKRPHCGSHTLARRAGTSV
jgi:selenocysteine lyase/cysteine desulfurase